MSIYKLTRTFNDHRIGIDKLKFESFRDAVKKAEKWIKSDDNIESVKVKNGTFTAIYTRP